MLNPNPPQALETYVAEWESCGYTAERLSEHKVLMKSRMGRSVLLDAEGYGKVIVQGAHYWGAGDTLEEAQANYRDAGGTRRDKVTTLIFDQDTMFLGIDGMGAIGYIGNAPRTL